MARASVHWQRLQLFRGNYTLWSQKDIVGQSDHTDLFVITDL